MMSGEAILSAENSERKNLGGQLGLCPEPSWEAHSAPQTSDVA